MSALVAALRLTLEALGESGSRFALVGGLAVSARSEPRFTRDIDVAVAVASDQEAETLVRALLGRGWHLLAQVEQEGTGRLATVRLAPPLEGPTGGVVVDLLFASSGIEAELVAAAEPLEIFEEVFAPVATRAYLLALKVLAQDERSRPQDRIDARALLTAARPAELEQARAALELVRARGFHRAKDLLGELDELIRGI